MNITRRGLFMRAAATVVALTPVARSIVSAAVPATVIRLTGVRLSYPELYKSPYDELAKQYNQPYSSARAALSTDDYRQIAGRVHRVNGPMKLLMNMSYGKFHNPQRMI